MSYNLVIFYLVVTLLFVLVLVIYTYYYRLTVVLLSPSLLVMVPQLWIHLLLILFDLESKKQCHFEIHDQRGSALRRKEWPTSQFLFLFVGNSWAAQSEQIQIQITYKNVGIEAIETSVTNFTEVHRVTTLASYLKLTLEGASKAEAAGAGFLHFKGKCICARQKISQVSLTNSLNFFFTYLYRIKFPSPGICYSMEFSRFFLSSSFTQPLIYTEKHTKLPISLLKKALLTSKAMVHEAL